MSVHNLAAESVQDQQRPEKETSTSVQTSLTQPFLITASAAKKKVNRYLGLHWGQNFSVDDPVLQEPDRTLWVVPVWYSSPHEGRREKMLDVIIDGQTGELVEEENLRQTLEQFGR